MAGRRIKTVSQTATAAGSDGYVTVASVTGFYKNARAYVRKLDFTGLEAQISEVRVAANKLGLRLIRAPGAGSNYGRDDVSAYAPETRLNYKTLVEAFHVGALLTGGTSGATGTISRIQTSSPTAGYLVLTGVVGNFINNEVITDDGVPAGDALADQTQYVVSATVTQPAQLVYNPNDAPLT